jgi:hypothetical protein
MRKALFIVIVALAAFTGFPGAAAHTGSDSRATFEGHSIDLRRGWGEATACASIGATTTCFRTEAAMRKWLAQTPPISAMSSSCFWSLTLYEHAGYGGAVLYLAAQYVWIDLSSRGFNDKTSSYYIGACDSIFAEHADGGGSWYPGNTTAWASSPGMAPGWNDRISSVAIN